MLSILNKTFGFKSFRSGQLEAIETLLNKGRLLCIQPTGHGKSLLYQLPSCILPGITLVISPLLALMRDQISHLNNRFHIPAASINSDQSEEENADARLKAQHGQIKVLFVSPEQLDHVEKFQFLLHLPISLIVIDEAHCISTWGHDFRPSYRQILHFTSQMPQTKMLALTATADARVEKDIANALSTGTQSVHILRESMNRPNIALSSITTHGLSSKLTLCKNLLCQLEGSGLIYCATRENTELVAEYLREQGVSIIAYHAGLDSLVKREIQTAFAQDGYKVVAATTALGMGIDKSNLRFIIHFDIPGSITAYYQEVGRAGRDGLNAKGILLYDPQDKKVQEYFIESALPTLADFEKVLHIVQNSPEPPNLAKIKRETGLHPTRVTIVVSELLEQQHLKKELLKKTQVYLPQEQSPPLDLSRYTNQNKVKKEELQKILAYAENTTQCKMAILRQALGDIAPTPCNNCDICRPHHAQPLPPTTESVDKWLLNRPVPINEAKIEKLSQGLSVLDGKLRSGLFVHFMKQRALSDTIEPELLELLKTHLIPLKTTIQAIGVLPSNTWKSRAFVAQALGNFLQVPVLLDLFFWQEAPTQRQGELLNNDQRQFNVKDKMALTPQIIPPGTILLLDDYTGSNATLKEAARAFRKKHTNALIPFTIANVKWRLGKTGFV